MKDLQGERAFDQVITNASSISQNDSRNISTWAIYYDFFQRGQEQRVQVLCFTKLFACDAIGEGDATEYFGQIQGLTAAEYLARNLAAFWKVKNPILRLECVECKCATIPIKISASVEKIRGRSCNGRINIGRSQRVCSCTSYVDLDRLLVRIWYTLRLLCGIVSVLMESTNRQPSKGFAVTPCISLIMIDSFSSPKSQTWFNPSSKLVVDHKISVWFVRR